MKKLVLVAAASALAAGPPGAAWPQTAAAQSVITPTVCLALEKPFDGPIRSQRDVIQLIEQLTSVMRDLDPMLDGKPHLREAVQALVTSGREHAATSRKHLFAMEDVQARLRECGREAR